MPDLRTLENYSAENVTLYRNKRQGTIVEGGINAIAGAGGSALGYAVKAIDEAINAPDCRKFGCQEGNCWAYCTAVLPGDLEWCWTSNPNSGKTYKSKTPCNTEKDCDGCWPCYLTCSV